MWQIGVTVRITNLKMALELELELEDETQTAPAASSTEDRCPVCLEDYQQKAFVDACFRILGHSNP